MVSIEFTTVEIEGDHMNYLISHHSVIKFDGQNNSECTHSNRHREYKKGHLTADKINVHCKDIISAFSLVIRGVRIRSRWVYLSVAANRTYIMRTIKNMEKMNNLTQFNLQYNALHSSSFHCHGQQVTVTYYRSCILLFRVLHYSELSSGSMTYYYQDQEVFCLVTPIWRYF